MRYLIVLEQTEDGCSVQVPDLAVVINGRNIEEAKLAAIKAIETNLEAYREAGKDVPRNEPAQKHMKNPDFEGLLFTYVNVGHVKEKKHGK